MTTYQLTIQVATLAELRQLVEFLTNGPVLVDAQVVPTVHAPASIDACPNGHGSMRLIPAGIAKAGQRIGQPYPAFWKCDTCGARAELPK